MTTTNGYLKPFSDTDANTLLIKRSEEFDNCSSSKKFAVPLASKEEWMHRGVIVEQLFNFRKTSSYEQILKETEKTYFWLDGKKIFVYDENGNPTTVFKKFKLANIIKIIDAFYKETEFRYDPRGYISKRNAEYIQIPGKPNKKIDGFGLLKNECYCLYEIKAHTYYRSLLNLTDFEKSKKQLLNYFDSWQKLYPHLEINAAFLLELFDDGYRITVFDNDLIEVGTTGWTIDVESETPIDNLPAAVSVDKPFDKPAFLFEDCLKTLSFNADGYCRIYDIFCFVKCKSNSIVCHFLKSKYGQGIKHLTKRGITAGHPYLIHKNNLVKTWNAIDAYIKSQIFTKSDIAERMKAVPVTQQIPQKEFEKPSMEPAKQQQEFVFKNAMEQNLNNNQSSQLDLAQQTINRALEKGNPIRINTNGQIEIN